MNPSLNGTQLHARLVHIAALDPTLAPLAQRILSGRGGHADLGEKLKGHTDARLQAYGGAYNWGRMQHTLDLDHAVARILQKHGKVKGSPDDLYRLAGNEQNRARVVEHVLKHIHGALPEEARKRLRAKMLDHVDKSVQRLRDGALDRQSGMSATEHPWWVSATPVKAGTVTNWDASKPAKRRAPGETVKPATRPVLSGKGRIDTAMKFSRQSTGADEVHALHLATKDSPEAWGPLADAVIEHTGDDGLLKLVSHPDFGRAAVDRSERQQPGRHPVWSKVNRHDGAHEVITAGPDNVSHRTRIALPDPAYAPLSAFFHGRESDAYEDLGYSPEDLDAFAGHPSGWSLAGHRMAPDGYWGDVIAKEFEAHHPIHGVVKGRWEGGGVVHASSKEAADHFIANHPPSSVYHP